MSIHLPYLPYPKLREAANKFLHEFHPSFQIPVPIEEIAEFKLGLNIIPEPGLQNVLRDDGHGILGYTTSDLKEICVDEHIWRSRPRRYRFTLAHEIGHIVLHRELFESHPFHTIDEWKAFIKNFPAKEYGFFEWQAYCFAGLVLVPESVLKPAVSKNLKTVLAVFKMDKCPSGEEFEPIWDTALELSSDDFDVSREALNKRAEYDVLRAHFEGKNPDS